MEVMQTWRNAQVEDFSKCRLWCFVLVTLQPGLHLTLEVTGELGQQLEIGGLLVRNFSLKKKGLFSGKTKNGVQTVIIRKNWPIF